MSCSGSLFPVGDGGLSFVLSESILLQTTARATGCCPRRSGCGHAGCHGAPAHPSAMLLYQLSPTGMRGELGVWLLASLPSTFFLGLGGDSRPVPPWGQWVRGVRMLWGSSGWQVGCSLWRAGPMASDSQE